MGSNIWWWKLPSHCYWSTRCLCCWNYSHLGYSSIRSSKAHGLLMRYSIFAYFLDVDKTQNVNRQQKFVVYQFPLTYCFPIMQFKGLFLWQFHLISCQHSPWGGSERSCSQYAYCESEFLWNRKFHGRFESLGSF
jgi:hypothetical protein